MTVRSICVFIIWIGSFQWAGANNITISNVARQSINTTQDFVVIRFDISWENSWRDADNYDATWVFVKFRAQGSTAAWGHASLHYINGTSDGHYMEIGRASCRERV